MRFSLRAALLGGGPGEGLPSPGKASMNKKLPSVSNVLITNTVGACYVASYYASLPMVFMSAIALPICSMVSMPA